jgi:DNA-binding transcriptional MerR regulator
MLTISELAGFVGVTVRAVRHYHARGLLPEPERDVSGYRRYGAQAVVDLIRIKTLAEAGVPLSRVSELMDAGPEQFAQAVEQIDRDLRAKIRELKLHRERVAQLAAGENLVLPAEVVDYLGRLRALGVSERNVTMERDGWIMIAAHAPDRVTEWVLRKRDALDDPAYRDICITFDQAFDWSPDDPRLRDLARAMIAFVARMAPAATADEQLDAIRGSGNVSDGIEESVYGLIESQMTDASPAWRRLTTLVDSELQNR